MTCDIYLRAYGKNGVCWCGKPKGEHRQPANEGGQSFASEGGA